MIPNNTAGRAKFEAELEAAEGRERTVPDNRSFEIVVKNQRTRASVAFTLSLLSLPVQATCLRNES